MYIHNVENAGMLTIPDGADFEADFPVYRCASFVKCYENPLSE